MQQPEYAVRMGVVDSIEGDKTITGYDSLIYLFYVSILEFFSIFSINSILSLIYHIN